MMNENDEDFFARMDRPQAGFQKVDDRAIAPEYKSRLAAGFDLAVIESATIYPGEKVRFRTGLVIQPPEGHWTLLVPRSSLSKRGLVLANTIGVIDEDYCGPDDEIIAQLRNVSSIPVHIEAGERVVQGVFIRSCQAVLQPTVMTAPSRGGWGSTGV